MSRVKATVNFIHAWQHPDEIADEVEAELRFPRADADERQHRERNDARRSTSLRPGQSFGDFDKSRQLL
jgi:hypothetical protein